MTDIAPDISETLLRDALALLQRCRDALAQMEPTPAALDALGMVDAFLGTTEP